MALEAYLSLSSLIVLIPCASGCSTTEQLQTFQVIVHRETAETQSSRVKQTEIQTMRPCLISTARRRLKVASSLSALSPRGSQNPMGSWQIRPKTEICLLYDR